MRAILTMAVVLIGVGTASADGGREYVFRDGDTLAKIAHREFGDWRLWETMLTKPNGMTFTEEEARHLVPGQKIVILERGGQANERGGQANGGFKVRVVVDLSAAPEAKEFARKAKALIEEWYPRVVEMLDSDGFTPHEVIELRFVREVDETDGVPRGTPGYAQGNRITLNATYLRTHPNDYGMVIHEMTHTIQGGRDTPSWMVEGVADYVRYHKYEPNKKPKINPRSDFRKDKYATAAALLDYAAETYDEDLVQKLNAAARAGKYKDELFRQYTGKTVDRLWAEYLETLRN